MNWKERKRLREERARLHAEMKAINDKAVADNARELTEDESTAFDKAEARSQEIQTLLERAERVTVLEDSNRSEGDGETRSQTGPGRGELDQPETRTDDIPERDLAGYSLLKVIRSQIEHRPLDGIEREMSDEIATRSNRTPEGVFVPHNIPMGPETRDLNLSAGSGAVATNTPATLIELLRAKVIVAGLGARMMGGLVGDLSLPKQTGGATAYWVDEGNAPDESNQSIGQVGLAPKTVGAWTQLSRKFIKQSSLDAEGFVRNDLAETLARAIDAAVLNGSGVGSEPEGIMQNASVASVAIGANGGDPTFAHLVGLETEVASSNADMGNLAYVTNARGRGKLKQTQKVSGQAEMLWNGGNQVNGYAAQATNLLPADLTKGTGSNLSPVLFGNWADVIIGMWGGLDILVDPYTGGNAGNVRVNALQDVDIALRHVESFAKLTDMATAA